MADTPPPDSPLKGHLPIYLSAAADDAGLSVHAFRVLARICRRWGEKEGCFESGAAMAKACRMKRDTLFRALSELEDSNIIKRTERPGQTSRIDVLPVEKWTQPVPRNGTGTRPPKRAVPDEGASPETGHPPVPRNGTPPVPNGGTQRDTTKGTHEGNPLPPKSPKGGSTEKVKAEDVPLPDWIDPERWAEWVQHRKEKRSALTPTTIRRQLKALERFRNDGHDPNAILLTSIEQGWTGIFEPKARSRPAARAALPSGANYGAVSDIVDAALGIGP